MDTTICQWLKEEASEAIGILKAGVSAYLKELRACKLLNCEEIKLWKERVASLRNNRRGSVRCSEKEGRVRTLDST